MLLSLIIVPVVSLFTKSVPFEVNPPSPEGAIDREYQHELAVERKARNSLSITVCSYG